MASRSFDSHTKICSKHAGDKPIDDKIGLWRDKKQFARQQIAGIYSCQPSIQRTTERAGAL